MMPATSLASSPEKRMGEAPGGAPGTRKRQSDYKRSDLTWREHPDGWALHCVGRRSACTSFLMPSIRRCGASAIPTASSPTWQT
jgi:hypothetical protein